MATASSPKIHTRIGHDRALCGVNPHRSVAPLLIVSNTDFVTTPHGQRCGKCAQLYAARGYKIDIPAKPKPEKFHRRATAAYYRQGDANA